MTCRIALNTGSIVCSCVSTQKGTILKVIVDFLNLLNRKSYRHSLIFFCVVPCILKQCYILWMIVNFLNVIHLYQYNKYEWNSIKQIPP